MEKCQIMCIKQLSKCKLEVVVAVVSEVWEERCEVGWVPSFHAVVDDEEEVLEECVGVEVGEIIQWILLQMSLFNIQIQRNFINLPA